MTLNYIGSKKKLLPFLNYVITQNIKDNGTFGDLFAGTGVVGEYFSNKGFTVTANDTEKYSYVINYATLISTYNNNIKKYIDKLNELKGVKGIIYKNYSPNGNRKFFTEENAMIADSIRIKIEELKNTNKININEYYFLLASLIQSLDKVANTTSVYGAFLKKFKKSSLRKLILIPIHNNTKIKKNVVLNNNVLDFDKKLDVIYLDPPYVARQYGGNYCPLNFLVEYDEKIKLRGKTGLYDYYKSPFASKSKAKNAFIDLFKTLTQYSSHIFLSYNNQGILSLEEMTNIMKDYGSVITYKYSYKKYQAVKTKGGCTLEYIHYLDCNTNNEYKEIEITKEMLK